MIHLERHGIYSRELPTSVLSTLTAGATPVVFGTAPVHLSKRSSAPVNVPVLCSSYKEAVEAFGYSDNWADYTLCEFMYSHFVLFGQAPVVLVNVLDPTAHKIVVVPADMTIENGYVQLQVEGILLNSITVKSKEGTTTYVEQTDYTLAYDSEGYAVISVKSGGSIPPNATQLKVGYTKLDPSNITKTEIIGGIDVGTGGLKGLELVQQVFPRFGLVPGLIVAPGFSHEPEVAAAMLGKAKGINGHFNCITLVDLPTDTITNYTEAPAWKNENNYTSDRQIPFFPKLQLGDRVFHMSTQMAGLICQTDQLNGGVPFASPSNRSLQANGALLANGTELYLDPDQANFLNANGIATALNFIGGWKAWGNRTAAYPAVTDPVKAFIPVRRMMDWVANAVILTYWQKLDSPANKRLIETVTDSINIWLNGLQASGYLLGGRVEFRSDENPTTSLMDGKLTFHLFVTPPSPAQEFEFLLEYDPQYLAGLTA